jgi:hypothetical protein
MSLIKLDSFNFNILRPVIYLEESKTKNLGYFADHLIMQGRSEHSFITSDLIHSLILE